MTDIATKEPLSFIAGDTVKWKRCLSDYKATDGWELYYSMRGDHSFELEATAQGDDHLITITAAESAAYTAATYKWIAYVEKAGERYTVDQGYMTVQPDLATGTDAITDELIQLEKDVAAIKAFLAKNYKYANYAINGRSLTNYAMADLFLLKDRLQRELNRLRDAEKLRRGLGTGKTIRVRFNQ
jgi:hypothetical protein